MIPNARLTSFKNQTGQTGSGEPVFGVERLGSPVPCQLVDPSSYKIDAAARRGIRLDTVLIVPKAAFVVAGRLPTGGDRVTVRPDGLLESDRAGDIVDSKDSGDGFIHLMLGQRVGGAS